MARTIAQLEQAKSELFASKEEALQAQRVELTQQAAAEREAAIQALKEAHEETMTELSNNLKAELEQARSVAFTGGKSSRSDAEIKAQVDTLKTKEEYALKDQKLTDEKISGIRNQEKSVQENLKRLEAEMRKLEETLGAREEHINTVNARIAKVETKVFAAFSRESRQARPDHSARSSVSISA